MRTFSRVRPKYINFGVLLPFGKEGFDALQKGGRALLHRRPIGLALTPSERERVQRRNPPRLRENIRVRYLRVRDE